MSTFFDYLAGIYPYSIEDSREIKLFDKWVKNLSPDELINYAGRYGQTMYCQGKESLAKEIYPLISQSKECLKRSNRETESLK